VAGIRTQELTFRVLKFLSQVDVSLCQFANIPLGLMIGPDANWLVIPGNCNIPLIADLVVARAMATVALAWLAISRSASYTSSLDISCFFISVEVPLPLVTNMLVQISLVETP